MWHRVTQNIGFYPIFQVNLKIVCSLNTQSTRKYSRVNKVPIYIPDRIFQHFYTTRTRPLPNLFLIPDPNLLDNEKDPSCWALLLCRPLLFVVLGKL